MMRTICTVMLVLAVQLLAAQNYDAATAFMVEGEISYIPESGEAATALKTGELLNAKGIIRLEDNARLGLSSRDQYLFLNEAGTYKIADLRKDLSRLKENDYSAFLRNNITEATHPYFKTVKVSSFGFASTGGVETSESGGTKPPVKKEKDGHGNSAYQLVRLRPTGGLVAGKKVLFLWKRLDENTALGSSKLEILNEEGEVIFQKNTQKTSLKINASKIGLENNTDYRWKVSAEKDPEIRSLEVPFRYQAEETQTTLLKDLYETDMYKASDRTARLMLEACLLENKGYLAAAFDRLVKASKRDTDNQLAQLLYKAFLWKYDMVDVN